MGTADIGTPITNPVAGENLAVGHCWRGDHGLRSWVVSRSPSCPCKPGTPTPLPRASVAAANLWWTQQRPNLLLFGVTTSFDS